MALCVRGASLQDLDRNVIGVITRKLGAIRLTLTSNYP
jgi:hypothetical protein